MRLDQSYLLGILRQASISLNFTENRRGVPIACIYGNLFVHDGVPMCAYKMTTEYLNLRQENRAGSEINWKVDYLLAVRHLFSPKLLVYLKVT